MRIVLYYKDLRVVGNYIQEAGNYVIYIPGLFL